jgi:hypothetical protein
MDPVTMMALSSIPSLVQAGFGIADRIKANKLYKDNNLGQSPQMEVPESMNAYVSLQEKLAQTRMPGYNENKSAIGGATAGAYSNIRQSASTESGALTSMLGAYSGQQNMLRDLSIRALDYQNKQQQNLGQAYLQKAGVEQQMFEYNKWLPWQMKMNQYESLRGAGTQNIVSGLDSLAGAGIQGANMKANQDQYTSMIAAINGGK